MQSAPSTSAPRLGPTGNAEVLNRTHAGHTAEDLLSDMIKREYRNEIALVSSFGADAVVLLRMVSKIAPDLPVLFLETGMLFPETLAYQQQLAEELGLTDVRLIKPDHQDLEMLDPDASLHQENNDGCCYLRKTLPLRRALEPFAASITGRKRHQAATRAELPLFEPEGQRLKINPLINWTPDQVHAYIRDNNLPRHPLVDRGFPSIGCAPCTTPVAPGEDPRAGRWRGQDKIECGIHFDGAKWRPQKRENRISKAFQ
ncbi:MAG: phosphoadenylyl-sulfate reductase [Pseudomonadota bacterium]